MSLTPHPRLCYGPAEWRQATQPAATPFMQAVDDWLARQAEEWVLTPEVPCADNRHNAHLLRNRDLQGRVMTLIVRWQQTGDALFLDAVVRYIERLGTWRHWSWIAMRAGDDAPDATFDLSYGENSATLALAYDLCHHALTPAQRERFVAIARHWAIAAGLKYCRSPREGGIWWFGHAHSNWNTVCAGGLGMLCLAMREAIPETGLLLRRVETSIEPYMRHLDQSGGAWPEGIGYWNYGMRYAFLYLMSHERATGREHPLLRRAATRQTLRFPLDFTPDGCAAGFGDVNRWTPLPFHFLAARRLRVGDVGERLREWLARKEAPQWLDNTWAPAAAWRLAAPEAPRRSGRAAARPRAITHYRGQDWLVLHSPGTSPAGHLAIRGGSTAMPHAHADLFSFNYVLNGARLLGNENNEEYLDTTFSPRRNELPDINAQFKNVAFLNGVSIVPGAACGPARVWRGRGANGVLLSGAGVFGVSRNGEAALDYRRLYLSLPHDVFVIVDRVQTHFPARFEARCHTRHLERLLVAGARLTGSRARASVAFAATVPALLVTAATAPTTPQAPSATMLRWCTEDLHREMILVTAFAPGHGRLTTTVEQGEGRRCCRLALATRQWRQELALSRTLLPIT